MSDPMLQWQILGVLCAGLLLLILFSGYFVALKRDRMLKEHQAASAATEARLNAELDTARGELLQARDTVYRESIRRAAAEEKNNRIPLLETELERRADYAEMLRGRQTEAAAEISELRTQLAEERKAAQEKLALLEDAQRKLSDAFQALSAEALRANNQSFLELAKANLEKFQESAQGDLQLRQQAIGELVKPLRESLDKVQAQIGEAEKARVSAYAGLTEQVQSLATSQTQLQAETGNLVKALRSPITRGRWGEIQLQRVVEMAGMLEYCDFVQQETAQTEEGRLRPDMIVRLPNEKSIVVDSKVSLQAYLDALEARDEESRVRHLRQHARQVAAHIDRLGEKQYWKEFSPTPEFVVLFLPGEPFFSAALEHDPSLIERGADRKVVLATPTTLIALLRAVAYGWRQDQLAKHALVIGELGRELYKRVGVLAGHFEDLRKGIERAATAYNKAAGTLESRVLVTMRRFKDLGIADESDIEEMQSIETATRPLQAGELTEEDKTDPPPSA